MEISLKLITSFNQKERNWEDPVEVCATQ
jgi:hypothetical protein